MVESCRSRSADPGHRDGSEDLGSRREPGGSQHNFAGSTFSLADREHDIPGTALTVDEHYESGAAVAVAKHHEPSATVTVDALGGRVN